VPLNNRLRYFRAFDYNEGPESSGLLLKMIENNKSEDTSINRLVLHHLDVKTVKGSSLAQNALKKLLNAVEGKPEYIELVQRYELKSENERLLELAINKPNESIGKNAAGLLLKFGGTPLITGVINGKDSSRANALISSLSKVGSKESIDMLQAISLSNKYPIALRKQAASKLGKSSSGEDRVLELLKNKKVPEQLIPDVVASVQQAWRKSVRTEASSYLPNAVKKVEKKVPSMPELLALKADAAGGKAVFMNYCSVCHQVNNEGADFGPRLTEIGSKYPKDGMLKSIVYPSAGISFNSEGYEISLKDGSTLTGIISSKTETDIDLKYPGGSKQQIKTSDVKSIKQLKVSMMPEGLHESMSTQDLANLLEYLNGLKKKQ
jgi:putative heme-binding domain-containing protein